MAADRSGVQAGARLLLVSGPSAAGKSTFLERLRQRDLPPDILQALPAGAERWAQTNGRRIVHRRREEHGSAAESGVVFHYDIMRPFESAIRDYGDDPDLSPLRRAGSVTLVLIRPAAEDLARRLRDRPPRTHVAAAIFEAIHGGLSPVMPTPLRRRRKAYSKFTEHARHRRLVEGYGQAGWLDSWYRRWEDFVAAEFGERLQRPILTIEPADGNFRFRRGRA